jgi:hypothetical protein
MARGKKAHCRHGDHHGPAPAVLGGTIGPVRRACSFVAPLVAGSRFTGSM